MKRLTETRWSGNFDSVPHVHKYMSDLAGAIAQAATSKKLALNEDKALATGVLHQICDRVFIFVDCMLQQILKPINIVVKQLQSSSKNVVSALNVMVF